MIQQLCRRPKSHRDEDVKERNQLDEHILSLAHGQLRHPPLSMSRQRQS